MSSVVDSRIGSERLLLVDDHRMIAEGLAGYLNEEKPGIVTDIAVTCEEAVAAVERARYDLVLLDWHLPGSDGNASIRALRRARCEARILIISGDASTDHIHSALQCGAAGFIPKTYAISMLGPVLDLVLRGGVFLPPEILGHSLGPQGPAAPSALLAGPGSRPAGAPIVDRRQLVSLDSRYPSLTTRQRDVLRTLLQGNTNKMIARHLGIEETTVKTHVSAVFAELGVSNRSQVFVLAAREGIHVG